jgi:large subunit ribosomal protein L9
MMVILRENIQNLGIVGDVIRVSDGYARNFLLPRQLVYTADPSKVAMVEHHKRLLEKKRLAQKAAKKELAEKLSGLSFRLARKVAEEDRLFGSVTSLQVWELLASQGYDLAKNCIVLEHPIKSLGNHRVTVKLEADAVAVIHVEVVKE